jgi:hypothetical protein
MKERCQNTESEAYKHYGAKGVTLCLEWQTFPPFEKWSRENGEAAGLEIDRIRGKEGYGPGNCRWVTKLVNNRNRCTVKLSVESAAEIRRERISIGTTMQKFAERYGVRKGAICSVIHNKTWN